MGRHRIYNTEEEKRQANREKSKKHHDKYLAIVSVALFPFSHVLQSKGEYQPAPSGRLQSPKTQVSHLINPFQAYPTRARNRDVITISNAISTQKQENTSPVDSWLERAHRIEVRFDKLTNGNGMTFVDEICSTFILDRSKDSIHEHSIALSQLQKGIYRCHNEILQVAGVGSELSEVERVRTKICTIVSWVEEVFCHAIVGWSDVHNLYTSKRFMYQN
jgi:hypothetical protein